MEINNLFRTIVETNPKRVRCLSFNRNYAIYGMTHTVLLY